MAGTDDTTNFRLSSPSTSEAARASSGATGIDIITSGMQHLFHTQKLSTDRSLEDVPEAMILSQLEETTAVSDVRNEGQDEMMPITGVHNEDMERDRWLRKLKRRLDALLTDLQAGKSIEYSQLAPYDIEVSKLELSRKPERMLLYTFDDILSGVEAGSSIERAARRYVPEQKILRSPPKFAVWMCCGCGDGPSTTAIIPGCALCGHRRCRYCKRERNLKR